MGGDLHFGQGGGPVAQLLQGPENRQDRLRQGDGLGSVIHRASGFGQRFAGFLVQRQARGLQGGDPVAQRKDVLTHEAGAHVDFPSREEKSLRMTKRSVVCTNFCHRTQSAEMVTNVGDQPRPNNGILVAITVMNGTLDSSGSPAM